MSKKNVNKNVNKNVKNIHCHIHKNILLSKIIISPYLCLRMKFGPRQHGKDWTKMRQRNHWWVRNDRKYTTAQI